MLSSLVRKLRNRIADPDEAIVPQLTEETPAANEGFASMLKQLAKRIPNDQGQGDTHARSTCAGMHLFSRARDYLVYTPVGYDPDKPLPLVMVLHGCHQTHHDIRAISGFDAIADREGFIVVYPFVTSYLKPRNENCWAWWMSIHIRAGSGEVEDLRSIIRQTQQEFSIDTNRIHLTGLSSGAGMTVAALVAHEGLFASGASVAGLAYGESARAVKISPLLSVKYHKLVSTIARMRAQRQADKPLPPLLIVQSRGDETVEPQAALNLLDSWLNFNHAPAQATHTVKASTRTINWQYQVYGTTSGHNTLTAPPTAEMLTVEQLAHGWIGGLAGQYSDKRGPNISEIIWAYFKQRPAVTTLSSTER